MYMAYKYCNSGMIEHVARVLHQIYVRVFMYR